MSLPTGRAEQDHGWGIGEARRSFFRARTPAPPEGIPVPPPGWSVAGRSGPATEGADLPMGWGR